ncbi:hypothetical protein [Paenibacillus sp. BJ-4]|uniref:hypothetical protein n=1 Tax=Paenibacillus sp. BJ-4 TaxID=2878097 RepID=UPI001CF0037A|nr:hypothetical protein [Paenibacillus sp. BJ-4]
MLLPHSQGRSFPVAFIQRFMETEANQDSRFRKAGVVESTGSDVTRFKPGESASVRMLNTNACPKTAESRSSLRT